MLRVAALASLFLSGPVPRAASQSYVVHSYTTTDGLPAPGVFSLAQDLSGNMWFATRGGIASYDGQTWALHPDPVMPSVRAYALLRRDERGGIWAASYRLGRVLARPPGGQWFALPDVPVESEPFPRTNAFGVTHEGDEVVVGVGSTFQVGFHLWRGGTWRRIGPKEGLPGERVRGIAGYQGVLFVVTEAGLARVSRNGVDASATALLPSDSRDLRAVAIDDAGEPWLLGRRFLGVLRKGGLEVITRALDTGEPNDSPSVLLLDLPRAVYVGSTFMLVRIDLATREVQRLGVQNGLVSDGVTGLLLDRERNLWTAGPRGVSKLVSRRFGTYRQSHGLLADEVTAIAEPRPGTLVFGHNSGLTVLRGGLFHRLPFADQGSKPLDLPRVLDMRADARGNTWLVATGKGLGCLSPGLALRWFGSPPGQEGLASTLFVESDGSITVAARPGLQRFDGRRFHPVPGTERVATYVRRMTRDRSGTLYLTSSTLGAVALRAGVVTQLTTPADEPSVRGAFAVAEDRQGGLWVGTDAGLFTVRDNALARPDSPDLRIGEPVFFVTQGRDGDLWFGTDRGVLRWNGARLRRYTPREGLAGWETNRAAGFVDSRGRVWIGTEAGVSAYEPEQDGLPGPPPLVELTAIETRDQQLSPHRPFAVPHDLNSLTFRFRAVSFLDERAVTVRCFLEGFDAHWSADLPRQMGQVRYTNLPPGRYRFHVKAANAAGAWSADSSSASFTIRQPRWREWWFVLGVLAAAAGLLTTAVKAALRWRYAERLEQEVAHRTGALRESESRYRRLFNDPTTAKLLVDPRRGLVVDANDSAGTLAKTDGPLIGRGLAEAGIPDLEEAVGSAVARGEGDVITRSVPASTGTREIEIRSTALTLGGHPHVLVTAQDVTERRRLEEERIKSSKLEALGVVAGGLAHDFNNLLMVVLSQVGLARHRFQRGLAVEANLATAEAAVLRASGLTSQLLTFAKGGAPLRRLTRLDELLRETTALVLAGSRSAFTLEIAPDLWPAEVDPGQIGQLIGNVVLNANQAMPDGGSIALRASNLAAPDGDDVTLPPGPYVRIAVIDEGVGIPAELVDRVFDPYFTTKEGGHGLGLTSCDSIVRRHGGQIRVRSVLHHGTTVTIYLPASPSTPASDGAEPPRPPSGRGRILIVDDEPAVRDAYGELLPELGYEPVVVADGAEGLRRFLEAREEGSPFRAVILDLTIRGGGGGKETLAELRRHDPYVKAIVASGYPSHPVLSAYREAGFAGRLRKPFGSPELSRALHEVLQAD